MGRRQFLASDRERRTVLDEEHKVRTAACRIKEKKRRHEDQHVQAERWPVEIVIDFPPRCEGLTWPSNVMGTLHVQFLAVCIAAPSVTTSVTYDKVYSRTGGLYNRHIANFQVTTSVIAS